jgi:hypothetical protein
MASYRSQLFVRPILRDDMKVQVQTSFDTEPRVIKFSPRARNTPHPGLRDGQARGSKGSEKGGDDHPVDTESDNFRHRMLANGVAIVITIVLVAFGIWLATSIADLRKTQDCILMGRRNCAPIATSR